MADGLAATARPTATTGPPRAELIRVGDLLLDPLSTEVTWRGEALAAAGDWPNAARSYLESFSGSPQGAKAPEALYRLGLALGRLDQLEEACLTLAEVRRRYPSIPAELGAKVDAERQALSCG